MQNFVQNTLKITRLLRSPVISINNTNYQIMEKITNFVESKNMKLWISDLMYTHIQ